MTADPIVYQDRPGRRVLDLRPLGAKCIPVLGLSSFKMIHPGTDYHIHPGCVEICLCVRGNLAFETENRTYSFLPGSIFVSTEHEPHRMRHNPKGLMLYRLLFAVPPRGRCILGLTRSESEWITDSLTHLPKKLFKSTKKINAAFADLFAIYDSEQLPAARTAKTKSAVLELLISVIEAARLLPPKAPSAIADIMQRMREHPDRRYPIPTLAAEASISPSLFSETFKRTAGLPPHAYLLTCRIDAARRMLAEGKTSIKTAAILLHFTSTQHFSTVFKRIVGMTPAAFADSQSKRR